MTEAEQFAAINTRAWYTAMRTQAMSIITAMQTTRFNVAVGGWITTTVEDVTTEFQVTGQEVTLKAGLSASGDPMYTWVFPIGWLGP